MSRKWNPCKPQVKSARSELFSQHSLWGYQVSVIWIQKNKLEAHGSHCSSEKQFQSINTFAQRYDYTITLIKRTKNIVSFLRIKIDLYLLELESPSSKDALCQVWLKLAKWFWRKHFSISSMFFLFSTLSPVRKGHGPSFEQTWMPFTQGYFLPSLVEICSMVLEKTFKFCQYNFAILQFSPFGEGHCSSFE